MGRFSKMDFIVDIFVSGLQKVFIGHLCQVLAPRRELVASCAARCLFISFGVESHLVCIFFYSANWGRGAGAYHSRRK